MIRKCLTNVVPAALLAGLLAPVTTAAQRARADAPGDLAIRVQYPTAGSVLDVADSTFLFGTVSDGRATLQIGGVPVPVHSNGAWLAWVAVPRDSAPVLRLTARLGSREVESTLPLRRAGWVREVGAWVASASMLPVGAHWLPPNEALPLRVRAARGARVRLLLADGTAVPFTESALGALPSAGTLAFGRDSASGTRISGAWYVASLARATATATGDWLSDVSGQATQLPMLEVVLGPDTARVAWPIHLARTSGSAVAVRLDEGLIAGEPGDGLVNGRTQPSGTYHWFFPSGTIAAADARVGESVRLRLDARTVAWVARGEVAPLPDPAGVPALMGSLTASSTPFGVRLRIPMSRVAPHQIRTSGRSVTITLFGVIGDADWSRMPVAGGFLEWLDWRQVEQDRVEIVARFAEEPWGWRVQVDGGALLVDVRTPPVVPADAPLAGRVIVVDAGHPPGGACGPTGRCEPELTLAVARLVEARLQREGATVRLTRSGMEPVTLGARVALTNAIGADALVSIHLNALPDGLNPFTNSGTSTFFQHPRGLALARRVQSELVAAFGLRDLGVARGDLALVRPTWYPAILTEALFLMVPEQEALIATPGGQARYAEAVVAGLRAFFRDAALSTPPGDGRLQ